MLNVLVCVSGGGTNLQALIDAGKDGRIRNARIAGVISNNRSAYALERARQNGIDAVCISLLSVPMLFSRSARAPQLQRHRFRRPSRLSSDKLP